MNGRLEIIDHTNVSFVGSISEASMVKLYISPSNTESGGVLSIVGASLVLKTSTLIFPIIVCPSANTTMLNIEPPTCSFPGIPLRYPSRLQVNQLDTPATSILSIESTPSILTLSLIWLSSRTVYVSLMKTWSSPQGLINGYSS